MNSEFDANLGGGASPIAGGLQRGSQNVRGGRWDCLPWRGSQIFPSYPKRETVRGPRFFKDNFRGNSVRQPFINVSPDGKFLYSSQWGSENFGDSVIVDNLVSSVKVVGEYSEDSQRNFLNDRSHLRFLLPKYLLNSETHQKVVNLDLKLGEADIQEYSGASEGKDFSNFLTWIINNKGVFNSEISSEVSSNEGGKFVAMKNIFSNLLTSPYRNNKNTLYATSVNGIIYLMKENYMCPLDRVGVWAHKFEQYMTREDTSEGVVCNEGFRVVLSSRLGPHNLLYSCATYCANPEEFQDDFTDLSSFVNLACLKEVELFQFQMMYWYNNYLLSGVPKTLLGQRNEHGVVTGLRLFEAPEMLERGKEYWNPANCLVFTSKLLTFIKDRVEAEPGAIFCIRKESGESAFSCTKTQEVNSVLPEWFLQDMFETGEERHEEGATEK